MLSPHLPSSRGSSFPQQPRGVDVPTEPHPPEFKVPIGAMGQTSWRQTFPPALTKPSSLPQVMRVPASTEVPKPTGYSVPSPDNRHLAPSQSLFRQRKKTGNQKVLCLAAVCLLGAKHTLNSPFMVSVLKVRTWLYFFVDVDIT